MFRHELGGGAELRLFQPQDARELFAFVEHNRVHLEEWLAWPHLVRSEADARHLLQECVNDFARDQVPNAGIWQDGMLAGGLFFYPIDQRIQAAEFGYWLGAAYEGRGLMTRALRVILEYVFGTLGMNRIALGIERANVRSVVIAERFGFVHESTRRDGWFRDGRFVDVEVYSLLAREADAGKRQNGIQSPSG